MRILKMALSTLQATLLALLTTGIASAVERDWPDSEAPGGKVTHTLAEWVPIGNASLLISAVNDDALGASLGLSVGQTLIQSSSINEAVASGDEFPAEISAQTLGSLTFILQHPTFDFGKTGVVQSVETLLAPYPDCLSKFQALKTRPASINVALFDGAVTLDDINAIVAG
jgi:hypothetical protein